MFEDELMVVSCSTSGRSHTYKGFINKQIKEPEPEPVKEPAPFAIPLGHRELDL